MNALRASIADDRLLVSTLVAAFFSTTGFDAGVVVDVVDVVDGRDSLIDPRGLFGATATVVVVDVVEVVVVDVVDGDGDGDDSVSESTVGAVVTVIDLSGFFGISVDDVDVIVDSLLDEVVDVVVVDAVDVDVSFSTGIAPRELLFVEVTAALDEATADNGGVSFDDDVVVVVVVDVAVDAVDVDVGSFAAVAAGAAGAGLYTE